MRATLLARMRANPSHWRKYYHGGGRALELQCEYSLSDRIRYYWPAPEVARALERLETALDENPPPLALLRQYLPSCAARQRGGDKFSTRALLLHHIRQVLDEYALACGTV